MYWALSKPFPEEIETENIEHMMSTLWDFQSIFRLNFSPRPPLTQHQCKPISQQREYKRFQGLSLVKELFAGDSIKLQILIDAKILTNIQKFHLVRKKFELTAGPKESAEWECH